MMPDAATSSPSPNWGLVISNFGPLGGDPATLADLACLAEDSGWNGFYLTDTIQWDDASDLPASDPWIDLATIALRTDRIRLGLIVTAVPRYRPGQLARQAVTLDHLSRGRLILGVGAGDSHDRGFAGFGEEMDPKRRAAMLDEGLAILDGLWSGEPLRFEGEHYTVDDVALLPTPIQRPRIPIWVGWTWPNRRPMERAARWDGAVPFAIAPDGAYVVLTADDIRSLKQFIAQRRDSNSPFDIAVHGPAMAASDGDDRALSALRAAAGAGATWIVEVVQPDLDIDALRDAIRRGVPALADRITRT